MSELIRELRWFFCCESFKERKRLFLRLLKSKQLFMAGLRFRNLVSGQQFISLREEIGTFWTVAYKHRDSALMNQIWLYEERLGLYIEAIRHEYLSYQVTRGTPQDLSLKTGHKHKNISIFLKEFAGAGVGNGILMLGLVTRAREIAENIHVVVDRRQITLWRKNLSPENGFRVYSFEEKCPPELEEMPRLNISSLKNYFVQTIADIGEVMKIKLQVGTEGRLQYRQRYYRQHRLIVGLNYKSRNPGKDSPDLSHWCRLVTKVPATYILVQYDVSREEFSELSDAAVKSGSEVILDHSVSTEGDLYQFAVQLSALDLLVSIPSSASFYATALGVDALLILDDRHSRQFPIFSTETPWHPTTKLFHKGAGGYQDAFDKLEEFLHERSH
jgi:hypothetical protein